MKRIFLPLSFVLVAFFSSFVFCQTPTKLAKLIEDDLKESRFEFRFGYSSPQQGLIHQNKVDYRFNMSRFYIGFEFLPSISFLYQDLLHHSGKSTFASMALYSVYYPYELEIGKTTFLTTNSKVTNMTYDETDGSIYDFREDYKYDDKGNLIQRTVLDQGTDTADIFYYSYDLYGRLINRTINLKQQGYQLIDTMEYDGNKVIRHVQGYLNSQGFTSSEYKYFYSGNFIVRCDYSTQKEVGQFSVKFRVLYSNNGSRYTKMSTHYFPNGTLGDKTEETIIEGTNDVIQAYTRTSYYQNNVEDVFKMEIQYTPDNKFVKKILIEEDFEIVGTYEYEYNSKAELEETQSEEFSILTFPNPTTDYIHFGTEEPIERVEIMNTTGQLVIVQNGMNKVSVSHLPSGNYLVNIVTAKGIAQSQFIKE